MYICYVDESGHCGVKPNPKQPVEVVCGVLSDLTKLAKTQREHRALLRRLDVGELKASEAYRDRKDWKGVPPEERTELFNYLLAWTRDRKVRFLVSPIDAHRFFKRKASCSLTARLENPWEAGALHLLLGIQRHQQGKKNNKGMTLVVFDEQKEHDQRLLRLLESDDELSFTDSYTGFEPKPNIKNPPVRLDQIVDVPHFSKSHLAAMIQIADWAAFVVNRVLSIRIYKEEEAYAGELGRLESWYRGIEEMAVANTAMQRKGPDPLCSLFRDKLPPKGWSWAGWP